MKFEIKKKTNPNIVNYPTEDFNIAKSFSKRVQNEFGDFLKAVVIFGSSARKTAVERSDIDILIIVDDLSIRMTSEVIEAYKIIVEKIIGNTSTKIHLTSLTITSFWEYIRAGDPVGINILRDGVALVDHGFFEPLQALLKQGRIRPTNESVWNYFGRAPRTLVNSRWHILQATLDLYWAVIDSAHAAIMKQGEIPPSPEHVADIMDKVLFKEKLVTKKYIDTMKKFYKIMKQITHREMKEIKGDEYEKLYREADEFVDKMQDIIEK